VRERVFKQGAALPEGFVLNMARALKLSSSQGSVVGLALAHSQYRALAQDGLRLLQQRLPEIASVADIPEEAVQGLLHFLVSSDVSDRDHTLSKQ
jgi:hypothetical protein